MNAVYRRCKKCERERKEEEGFTYLRDGIWSCSKCGSMHNYVSKVEEG